MSAQPSSEFCHRTWEEAVAVYQSNVQEGLSSAQAAKRLAENGQNELHVDSQEPWHAKLLEQFQNPLMYLLLGSAAVSLVVGEWDNAISITLAIVIVALVAFVQEYRSEQSLQALHTLVPHYANVRRDGRVSRVVASQLVPGDVVLFATGDRVPADVRLVTASDLTIDESSLTGETKPVRKTATALERCSKVLSLSERKNICFMGTLAKTGHGVGVIIGTARNTEFGAVFQLMREVEERKTPLQEKMDTLGKQLSLVSSFVIFVIVLIGCLVQKRPLLEMFTIGVSLAVAAIPEGLPVVVAVTLALGVLRLAERKAIMKKLPSIETLATANVLCVDKTGTLTTNQMTVQHVFTPNMSKPSLVANGHSDPPLPLDSALQELLLCAGLCNHAHQDADGEMVGQMTDCALLELVLTRFCLPDPRDTAQKSHEIPFSSERKFMASEWIVPQPEGTRVCRQFMKGAPSVVLESCTRVHDGRPLDDFLRKFLSDVGHSLAEQGLRVLALAGGAYYANGMLTPPPSSPNRSTESSFAEPPRDLSFLGFVSIQDPPRPGVSDTIARLHQSGVRVVMMTGDSEGTARAIARDVGIAPGESMSGADVDTQDALDHIESVSVFYRMSPADKLKVVKAYQAIGHVVAMTGDGVNDAPALRLADIGISMGMAGTDVAKEAADMILVNDSLATLVVAIEEGKSIFLNIRNFLSFQLSTSVAALGLVALATFMGLPNPLNAMQILWINIIMDGPPAQSLGVEPVDRELVCGAPPRPSSSPIITPLLVAKVLTSGLVIMTTTLLVYWGELASGASNEHVTTMTFTVFVLNDMFNAYSCRSLTRSVAQIRVLSNKMFNYAISFSILGHICVVHVPVFQRIFQTVPLSFGDWIIALLMASLVLIVDEVRKFGPKNVLRSLPGLPFLSSRAVSQPYHALDVIYV